MLPIAGIEWTRHCWLLASLAFMLSIVSCSDDTTKPTPPTVTCSSASYCVNEGVADISGLVTPAGGTFGGANVTPDGILNPEAAGAGDHAYTYTFTNNKGTGSCSGKVTVTPRLSLGVLYDTPDQAWDIAITSTLALVADRTSGIQAFDISTPGSLAFIRAINTVSGPSSFARAVAISDNHAYVASETRFHVIDITTTPVLRATLAISGIAWSVDATATHAYVANLYDGLQVVDITTPASPVIVGSVGTPGEANDVAIMDTYAYVADGDSGLQVIGISTPISPIVVGSVDTPASAMGVAVTATHAFVVEQSGPLGNRTGSLQVIDITAPASPVLVSSLVIPGAASGVAVSGPYVFVGAGDSGGVQMVDVTSPGSPKIVGSVDTPGYASGVAVTATGAHVYVADGTFGLVVVERPCP